MSEIYLEILRSGRKWTFIKSEIRIGRNQNCDVALSDNEFPMVGLEHAMIRTEGRYFWVEDLGSINGTIINGHRINLRQQLAPGDVIRLGSDGPEIKASFVSDQVVGSQNVAEVPTLRSALPPTDPSSSVSSSSTALHAAKPEIRVILDSRTMQVGSVALPQPDKASVVTSQNTLLGQAPTIPSQPAETLASRGLPKKPGETQVHGDAFALTIPSPIAQNADAREAPGSAPFAPAVPSSLEGNSKLHGDLSDSVSAQSVSREDEAMIEHKLNMLRNLAIGMFVILLVMCGVIISEMQRIDQNRTAILTLGQNMSKQANDAVGQLQPQLDARLKMLDNNLASVQDQMNGMDNKIRQSEDRFVQRMDKELPKIMDQYITKKMAELKKEVQH